MKHMFYVIIIIALLILLFIIIYLHNNKQGNTNNIRIINVLTDLKLPENSKVVKMDFITYNQLLSCSVTFSNSEEWDYVLECFDEVLRDQGFTERKQYIDVNITGMEMYISQDGNYNVLLQDLSRLNAVEESGIYRISFSDML